jgi:serine/threonine protein kinase
MAEVYKAYHPGLECYVAIKVLHPFLAGEKDFLARFEREARVVATFRHPNIVQVYDYESNVEDRCYYMVMEFIDGLSLKTRLQQMAEEGRRLPLDEAIRIVIAVANALDYAHRHGMVHRDIKPANIMFTQDGQVILTDFGIARMVDTTPLTASGAMVGTPAYMAPEQGMGQVRDERADIYSLGVMFYQLVTGDLPFDADTPMAIVLKHIHAPLLPPTTLDPSLPPAIEAVTVRALAKDPDKRYQTARDLADDLERYLAGEPVAPISPELASASATSSPETSPSASEAQQWDWPIASGTPTAPLPRLSVPMARPKRSWIRVFATVLALALLGSAVLLTTDTPSRLLAALLSSAATPTSDVIGTPTHTPTPDLTATYDANATQFAAWMSTYVATVGATPTPSPIPSPTPTSTPTPDLTVTAIAACVFDMEVVDDRPVRPSVLMPGQRFVKRWTIRNVGTCTWPEDIRLALVSGDELHVVVEPQIQPLSPEETAEIESTLQAPTAYDRYASVWQLQDSVGNPIGEQLEATYRVGATPTPRPTAMPTATSTPEFTPTPTEPLHFSVPIVVEWHDQRDGTWRGQVGLTAWGGDGTYRYYLNSISEENEFFNGAFEIESRTCMGWWGTVIVTSADEVVKWEGKVEYPDPSDCE